MNNQIKDDKGRVIGKVSDNRAYTFNGKFVGRYDENTDTTYDSTGRNVGRGDQTSGLLWSEDSKDD